MPGNPRTAFVLAASLLASIPALAQPGKDLITLDEFMNATEIKEVRLAPDGSAAVIATVAPDWKQNRFRSDLWIWKKKTGETVPLTRSGHAHSPLWSPDGRYIAFLSDLPVAGLEDKESEEAPEQIWLIGAEIPEYTFGNRLNHTPKRPRKLLLHRREIIKFAEKADQKGFTLVPIQMYFKDGRAKVEIGVGKGKQSHDKRDSLKKADAKREIDRAMAARRKR